MRLPCLMLCASAALAAGPAVVQAEDGNAEVELGTCYAASFEREQGPVRELTVRVDIINYDEGASPVVSSAYTLWDVPNQVFDAGAGCSTLSGGRLRCQIDCDGGDAMLMAGRDGKLLMQASHMRHGLLGEPSILAPNDADGSSLDGLFVLTPRPGSEVECRPAADTYFAELAPGDISPRVRSVEGLLSRLGDFLFRADTVYDEATADAVSRFQRRAGLDANGIVDARTAQVLADAARAAGGC